MSSTGLSTSATALVDRQSVRVPGAKLCFADLQKKTTFPVVVFAARPGIEPRFSLSESDGLPLADLAILILSKFNQIKKFIYFFLP